MADDRAPRGKPVRSWEIEAAINALPSDATLNPSFRMTCLQAQYYEAAANHPVMRRTMAFQRER